MSLKSVVARWKDESPYLKYLWLQTTYRRLWKKSAQMTDLECIITLYKKYSGGRMPNLEDPHKFSEKMQWLKLHYRNELMPVVGDKFSVRKYLQDLGYGYLLNELITVYDDVNQIHPEELPERFVLKATHASGWNMIVKDNTKVNWLIWRKHFQYWLSHNIAWNGREWHYAEMKPRIVCEKYLEDDSGALMDYKFYCFNGEPRFLQVNVGRGTAHSTQNYYDLNWQLLPFGKSQPHNPDAQVDRPTHFNEMVKLARELTKSFPYVRFDLYEVGGRIYFGEFTFFPCSGMPDFIPSEWDDKVGEMLILPIE